jgi:phosphatidylglycerophosphatase C
VSARELGPEELIGELDRHLNAARPSGLAFDADGTLWSGDVGDDVFRFAVRNGRLREAARAEIEREATTRGFDTFADVNATAEHLFEAYLARRYPEREMCELMTWCYAGHTLAEMKQLAVEALAASGHAERLHRELAPVLKCARERGLRAIVVSASPRATVELAASAWGFAPQDIAASTPQLSSGVIAPHMDGVVPYAAAKCVAGRALLGSTHWLASFGDNVFDLEMLLEAEVGVVVRPKPALRARLTEIPGVVLLDAKFQQS